VANTNDIALADVDNDGDLDVVAGNNGRNRLYLNIDGAGAFSDGVDITADSNDTQTVALGDVNGSGSLDLVAGNLSTFNRRLHINGNPTTAGIGAVNVGAAPVDVDLFAAFNDLEDGTALAYSIDSDSNPGVVATSIDQGLGTLTLTGTAGGSTDLVVQATDSDGLFVDALITVTVQDLFPPVITLVGNSPIDVALNSVYSDAGATAVDDVDGDISLQIVTVNPVDTAVLGTYTVTYDVVDSSGNAATQVTRTVNVVDTGVANNPPVLDTPIGDQTVAVGQAVNVNVSTAFSDPDSDTLTFTAAGLPASLSISTAGVITGAPEAGDVSGSPFTVTVTANDGNGGSVDGTFTLTVQDGLNDPPVLSTPIASRTATVGQRVTVDVSAAFTDPDGDTLTFTAAGLPASLSISTAGIISGTPTSADTSRSPFTVTVTANDGNGGSVGGTFTLTVRAAATGGGGGGSSGANGPLLLLGLWALALLRGRGTRFLRRSV
jgi:hypothetical protein